MSWRAGRKPSVDAESPRITDFICFKATSRSLTGALYHRMSYGPVPVGFNGLRTQLEADEIVTINEVAFPNGNTGEMFRPGPCAEALCRELTDDDIPMLRLVRDRLGGLTPSALSDRSHEEAAWKETPHKAVISYEKAMSLSVPVDRSADSDRTGQADLGTARHVKEPNP